VMSAREIGVEGVEAVGVAEVPGGVIAVEFNGFQGSRPEVLRAVSAGGKAASAYWNVNSATRVSLAQSGRLLSAFEAGADSRREGEAPHLADPLMTDLGFEPGQCHASMLVITHRFTGLMVTPEVVAGIDGMHVITPVLSDPPPSGRERDALWLAWAVSDMAVGDQELTDLILEADPGRQREFAVWAAVEALTEVGLIGDSAVEATLRTCRSGVVASLQPAAAKLVRDTAAASDRAGARDGGGRAPDTRATWMRAHATNALYAAASYPETIAAAIQAATEARLTFWNRPDDWKDRARHFLGNTGTP
jgi:Family of unknown function (DUF6461)